MSHIRKQCQLNNKSTDYPTPALNFFSVAAFVYILLMPFNVIAACPPQIKDFHQPKCIDNSDGVLDIELDMQTSNIDIDPGKLTIATYNDSLPGPTLRLKQGDRLKILLKNNMQPLAIPDNGPAPPGFLTEHTLPDGLGKVSKQASQIFTNLHTHGFQVSPNDPSDNVYLAVQPGQCHQYAYDIPDGIPATDAAGLPTPPQPAGLHWYHPHFHGSTTHQGWQGLSGAIVIEGDIDKVPAVAAAGERLLVLNELWIDDNGSVPTALVIPNAGWSPFTSVPAVSTNMVFTINGRFQPTIKIKEGETQRWRVLAAGPHRFFHFEVEGHSLYQIAQDGIPFARAKKVDRILLATGNRAEFIIKGGTSKSGGYKIRALAYEQGHPGGKRPEHLLGTLISEGKQKPAGIIPNKLVTPFKIPQYLIDELKKHPERHRTITFRGDVSSVPVKFTVNNKEFELDANTWWNKLPANPRPKPGTVEEWTLINEDIFQHPFHIHVNPFQVIEVNGVPTHDKTWNVDPEIWWDVFRLPPHTSQKGNPPSVKVRMYFRPDAPGLTVYHCHILPHEDNGMMASVYINKKGDSGTTTPQVNPNCPDCKSCRVTGAKQ